MRMFCYAIFLSFLTPINLQGSCLPFDKLDGGQMIANLEAKFFQAIRYEDFLLLKVKQPYLGAKAPEKVVLYSGKPPLCGNEITQIKLPVKRLVATSTTHLPPLSQLGLEDTLVGFGNIRFIHDPIIQKRVAAGKIREIGTPPSAEILMALKPDALMVFAISSPELEGIGKLEKLKLPIIYNADYRETSPLARAEWSIFTSFLYGKEREAKAIYQNLRQSYLFLKGRTKQFKKRPIVAVGKNNHGFWTAPGGDSDLAQMIQDAGGNYLWKKHKGREQIRLSLEEALIDMQRADIWLPQNTWKSLKEASIEDPRYKKIPVFKNGQIFNNNKLVNNAGGNDYWEQALMRPDLMLEDLIRIFHPGFLPGTELRWYKKIK